MPRDGLEIGLAEKPIRQKRAIGRPAPKKSVLASANTTESGSPNRWIRQKRATARTAPKEVVLASANISVSGNGDAAGEGHNSNDTHNGVVLAGTTSTESGSPNRWTRQKRAITRPAPTGALLASANISTSGDGDAAGEGHKGNDTHRVDALAGTINDLVDAQRQRIFCMTQKMRSERAMESFLASIIGFPEDAKEKERKAVFEQAKVFRLAVEKGGENQTHRDAQTLAVLSPYSILVKTSAETRKPWVDLLNASERKIADRVKALPVYEFMKSVKGFGEVGLGALVAEAGRGFGEFRTVSALWKRMGVAVIDGDRQRKHKDKVKAEAHGYSPRRRSQLWQVMDSLFKHQWRGDKDQDGKNPKLTGKPVAVPAHATGPYGEVYAQRLAHTLPRILATEDLPATIGERFNPERWTAKRCDNDARRVASKALLRDLWRVWNGLPPRGLDSVEIQPKDN
jgi:hypothetical protein